MKNSFIGIFCSITALVSCKFENGKELTETSFPVIIQEFSNNKLHHTDSIDLFVIKNESVYTHLFVLEKSEKGHTIKDHSYEINPKNESTILIDKFPARLISKKQYSSQNGNVTVRKYYYNIEDEADEEGWFFVSNDRIIAFYSKSWNLYRYYKYRNSIADILLEKDTTDFFNYRSKL